MARMPRQRSEADVYHIIVRGEGRKIIFEDDEDRGAYLRMLSDALRKAGGSILAWCLMANHVHLVLKVDFDKLPRMMRILNSGYAVYYNKRHDHVGHVFAGRYSSKPVEGDGYLLQLIRYVHFNPIKGGLCDSYDYAWSSYGEYFQGSGLVDTGFVLNICGSLKEFESYHFSLIDEAGLAEMGPRRRLSDDEARALAHKILGEDGLSTLSTKPREQRNEGIARLRQAGLSSRQVERLTGIGRGIVSRVEWQNV